MRGLQALAIRARATDWAKLTFRLSALALALWITTRVFNVFNDAFLHHSIQYDEGFFVWGGWSISKGLAPYKDFLEFKPPFVFLTHALALKLFGFENLGYRRFFALFPLASILFLQASLILRRIDCVLATTFAVCIVALFVNPDFHDTALSDSESIGVSYFLLGLAFLIAETKFRNVTDAIGAAFMTCCALSKEPFAPTVLTTWASVFLLRDGLLDFRRRATRYVKFTGLGVGLVIVALCIYMVPTGSMTAYLQMVGRYPRIYRDPTHSYCVVLGRFHPSTPLGELKTQWDGICKDFLNFGRLGYMAPMFAAGLVYITRRSLPLLAATFAGLVAGLWAVTASNCQWTHYYSMTMAGFFAFLAIGLDTMKAPFWAFDRWGRWFIRLAVVSSAAVTVYPRYDAESGVVHATQLPGDPVPGVLAFIAANSVPTDRILTTGPPLLYVLADRISAIRESNVIDEILGVYTGATDEEKLRPIHDELVKNMPKIVVLDPENGYRKTRHMTTLIMPFLKEFQYRMASENIYVHP
jgi:hypothetical protein